MLIEARLTKREIQKILNEVNEVESEIVFGESDLTVRYEDAYDIERIYVQKTQNEYGVKFYRLEIEYANRDSEIINCYSCHDPFCEACPLISDKEDIDELINQEIEDHESKPEIKLSALSSKLTIKPTIVETKCYLDIPHTHLYKGVYLEFETNDFGELIALMKLRDLFYKLL